MEKKELQQSSKAVKTVKGILKTSTSFDQKEKAQRKEQQAVASKHAKWDEMNILATFHPPDKDYGHMKVEEPKTPYHWDDETDAVGSSSKARVDPEELKKKLTEASKSPKKKPVSSSSDDSDDQLDEESKKKKQEFEDRRKKHYNEFQAVRLARKLMEEDDDEGRDDDDSKKAKAKQKSKK